jgi:hypothetical protein
MRCAQEAKPVTRLLADAAIVVLIGLAQHALGFCDALVFTAGL